jgi:hypothetical protein
MGEHWKFCLNHSQEPHRDPEGNRLWVYRNSTIARTVSTISSILAPLLPVISIFVLSAIQNPTARRYAIMAFTSIFSVVLTVITRSSRTENFAATAASVHCHPQSFFLCGTATGPMALAYGGLLGRPVADRILGLQQSKSSLSEGRVAFLKPSHRRL